MPETIGIILKYTYFFFKKVENDFENLMSSFLWKQFSIEFKLTPENSTECWVRNCKENKI